MCPGYAGVLDDTVLDEIFADIFAGRVSEGKDVEFKEGFGWRSLAVYLKTMAGFVNAEGGFLIFGVRDGSREPVGLDAGEARRFREMDGERVSTDLRSCFSREILWGFRLVSFGGREFGVIGVERGRVRPVVAIRDVGSVIRRGAIYYRYHSQTTFIEPAELELILEEERRRYLGLLLDKVRVLAESDLENTAVVNLVSGDFRLDGAGIVNVMIAPETLREIRFLREGQFVEREGAPALVLRGEVRDVVPVERVVHSPTPRAITQDEVWRIFLEQREVVCADEYLKQGCSFSSENLPFFYFVRAAGRSAAGAAEFLAGYGFSSRVRGRLIRRFSEFSRESCLFLPIGDVQSEAAVMKRGFAGMLREGRLVIEDPRGRNGRCLRYALLAVRSLSAEEVVRLREFLLSELLVLYEREFLDPSCSCSVKTEFRKAVCWVDEALYLMEGGV